MCIIRLPNVLYQLRGSDGAEECLNVKSRKSSCFHVCGRKKELEIEALRKTSRMHGILIWFRRQSTYCLVTSTNEAMIFLFECFSCSLSSTHYINFKELVRWRGRENLYNFLSVAFAFLPSVFSLSWNWNLIFIEDENSPHTWKSVFPLNAKCKMI